MLFQIQFTTQTNRAPPPSKAEWKPKLPEKKKAVAPVKPKPKPVVEPKPEQFDAAPEVQPVPKPSKTVVQQIGYSDSIHSGVVRLIEQTTQETTTRCEYD